MPRRSGTTTVWSRASTSANGAHMSPVSPKPWMRTTTGPCPPERTWMVVSPSVLRSAMWKSAGKGLTPAATGRVAPIAEAALSEFRIIVLHPLGRHEAAFDQAGEQAGAERQRLVVEIVAGVVHLAARRRRRHCRSGYRRRARARSMKEKSSEAMTPVPLRLTFSRADDLGGGVGDERRSRRLVHQRRERATRKSTSAVAPNPAAMPVAMRAMRASISAMSRA